MSNTTNLSNLNPIPSIIELQKPEDYLKYYIGNFTTTNITDYDKANAIILLNVITADLFKEKMWMQYVTDCINTTFKNFRRFSMNDLGIAILLYENTLKQVIHKIVYDSIKFTKSDTSHITQFLSIIKNIPLDQVDVVDVACLAQWIANVKRKIDDLEVYYPLMPYFYSDKQGTGKTRSARLLFSPLSPIYTDEQGLRELLNSFNQTTLNDRYVNLFDDIRTEVGTGDSADLKRLMSNEGKITVRAAHASTGKKVSYKCSYIGTGNHPISDVIHDSTGMRRFHQIEFYPFIYNETKVMLNKLREIDYVSMWCGIDPYYDYISDIADKLSKKQNKYKNFNVFQRFIYAIHQENINRNVLSSDLYIEFKRWCIEQGERDNISNKKFSQEMMRYSWYPIKKPIGKMYNTEKLAELLVIKELDETENV